MYFCGAIKKQKAMRHPNEIYACGTKVKKLSEKPFNSGLVFNTVKSVTEHPHKIDPETNKGVPAYTFFEDDSIVEAAAVKLVNDFEYSHNADKYFLDSIVKRLTYVPKRHTPVSAAIKGNSIRQLLDTMHSDKVNGQVLVLLGTMIVGS